MKLGLHYKEKRKIRNIIIIIFLIVVIAKLLHIIYSFPIYKERDQQGLATVSLPSTFHASSFLKRQYSLKDRLLHHYIDENCIDYNFLQDDFSDFSTHRMPIKLKIFLFQDAELIPDTLFAIGLLDKGHPYLYPKDIDKIKSNLETIYKKDNLEIDESFFMNNEIGWFSIGQRRYTVLVITDYVKKARIVLSALKSKYSPKSGTKLIKKILSTLKRNEDALEQYFKMAKEYKILKEEKKEFEKSGKGTGSLR